MKLYYPIFDKKIESLQEKMEEMVVTHELIQQKTLRKPHLHFGEDKVEGIENIQNYLEDLHRDMQKGYYCNC